MTAKTMRFIGAAIFIFGLGFGSAALLVSNIRYDHYAVAINKDNEMSLYEMWKGKTHSVQFGQMVIQRVKGNEVIVDRVDLQFKNRIDNNPASNQTFRNLPEGMSSKSINKGFKEKENTTTPTIRKGRGE